MIILIDSINVFIMEQRVYTLNIWYLNNSLHLFLELHTLFKQRNVHLISKTSAQKSHEVNSLRLVANNL